MSAGAPVLEVRGVTKAFGDREVLRGVDLTVSEHQAIALIGASGSGKSTLLRCIDGLTLASVEPNVQNVVLGEMRAMGASRSEAEEHGRALLGRFGLEGREDDRPDDLSGGQQQRVAIARAFAGRPRALLLDEVTSALDPELVGEVLEAVRDLKAEGMTMVIATHEMGFAREVADEVAFLHDGQIVELGPPDRVLTAPEREETRRFLARLLEAGRI